jgi:hypothetical protein
MSQHFPRIRFHASHGTLIIRDGLKICFYMRRSLQEVAQAVWHSLETYLRAVGPQALAWHADHQGDWGQLDSASWLRFRRDLLESNWSHHELTEDPDSGVPAFHFEYFGKRLNDPRVYTEPTMVSSVGFWLPTEFLEEHGPSRVRELALELATPLPFNSGHAGLCFNDISGYHETEKELSRLCLRYPGMDMLELEDLSIRIGTRVKGPAWLTFLGQPVLGELGGAEGLRTRLSSPSTTVQQLEGDRAVITLGPWPEAGDTEAGHDLPEYRELARVLEPWLYHSGGGYYFPKDIWQRWERRFLD